MAPPPFTLQDFLTLIRDDTPEKVSEGIVKLTQLAFASRFSQVGCPLLTEYVQGSPQCVELFNLLTKYGRKMYFICALVFQLLTFVFIFKIPQKGVQVFIGRTMLRKHMKTVKWLLAAEDQRKCAMTLRFLEALVNHGKTSPLAREVATTFDFRYTRFLRIASRKYSPMPKVDPREARYAFCSFAMSFLYLQDADLLTTILQQGFMTAGLLKGLAKDNIKNVEHVLRSFEHLLHHPTLPLQTRLGFFNRWVLQNICKLYAVSDEHATFAQQFMQSLLNELQQTEKNEAMTKQIHTSLLDFLAALRANEDLKQQELVLSILENHPKLIREYLKQLTFSFDPRPSFRWLANVNLLLKVYAVPMPVEDSSKPKRLREGDSGAEQTDLMDAIFPATLDLTCLHKGLQSMSVLVQFTTVKLLLGVFKRYIALKPSGAAAQAEYREQFRKRMADVDLLLRVRPHMHSELMQAMFLSLMECYQVHLPEAVLISRFDIWKLLAVPKDVFTDLYQYKVLKILRHSGNSLGLLWNRNRERTFAEDLQEQNGLANPAATAAAILAPVAKPIATNNNAVATATTPIARFGAAAGQPPAVPGQRFAHLMPATPAGTLPAAGGRFANLAAAAAKPANAKKPAGKPAQPATTGAATPAAKLETPPFNLRRVLEMYLNSSHEPVRQEALGLLLSIFRESGVFAVPSAVEEQRKPRDLEVCVWLECLTPDSVDFFENLVFGATNVNNIFEAGVYDTVCSPFLQHAITRASTPVGVQYTCRVCLRLLHSGLPSKEYLETLITCLLAPRTKIQKEKEKADQKSVDDVAEVGGKRKLATADSKAPAAKKAKPEGEEEGLTKVQVPAPPEFEDVAQFVRRLLSPQLFVDECSYKYLPLGLEGADAAIVRGPPAKFDGSLTKLCDKLAPIIVSDMFLSYTRTSLFALPSIAAGLDTSSSTPPNVLRALKSVALLPPYLLLTHAAVSCFQPLTQPGVKQFFLAVTFEAPVHTRGLTLSAFAQRLAAEAQNPSTLSPVAFNQATECFESLFNNLVSELNVCPADHVPVICDTLAKALNFLLPNGFATEPLIAKMMAMVGVNCIQTLQSQLIFFPVRQQLVAQVIAPWLDRLLSQVENALQKPSSSATPSNSFPCVWVLLRLFVTSIPSAKLRKLMEHMESSANAMATFSLIASYRPLAQHLLVHSIPSALHVLTKSTTKQGFDTDGLISTLMSAANAHPLCDVMSCVQPSIVADYLRGGQVNAAKGAVIAHCLDSRFSAYFARDFKSFCPSKKIETLHDLVPALNAYVLCPHADLKLAILKDSRLWNQLLEWGSSDSVYAQESLSCLKALVSGGVVLPSLVPDFVLLTLASSERGLTLSQLDLGHFLLRKGFTGHAEFFLRGLSALRNAIKKSREENLGRLSTVLLAVLNSRGSEFAQWCGRPKALGAMNGFIAAVLGSFQSVPQMCVKLLERMLIVYLSTPWMEGMMTRKDVYDLVAGNSKFIEIMIYPSVLGESFRPLASDTPEEPLKRKARIVRILTLLFAPTNNSASVSLEISEELRHNLFTVVRAGYQGTDAPVDVAILSFLCLFPGPQFPEGGDKWGRAALADLEAQMSETADDEDAAEDEGAWVYENFDKQMLLKGPSPSKGVRIGKRELFYDPTFVLAAILGVFQHQVDCSRAVSTSVMSFVVLCLSSLNLAIRKQAYTVLGMFSQMLDTLSSDDPAVRSAMHSSFPQLQQIRVCFSVLKNAITKEFMLLPAISTSFVSRILPILMNPGHFLYKGVNHFLLARPVLDITDVPMFYGLFNTGTHNARRERTWMLWMMLQGLVFSEDFAAMNRRYVFPIIMAFHDSTVADPFARDLVINIVKKGAGTPYHLFSLIEHHGLLAWLNSNLAETTNLHHARMLISALRFICAVLEEPRTGELLDFDLRMKHKRARGECLLAIPILSSLLQRFSLQEVTLVGEPDHCSLLDGVLAILDNLSDLVADMKVAKQIKARWKTQNNLARKAESDSKAKKDMKDDGDDKDDEDSKEHEENKDEEDGKDDDDDDEVGEVGEEGKESKESKDGKEDNKDKDEDGEDDEDAEDDEQDRKKTRRANLHNAAHGGFRTRKFKVMSARMVKQTPDLDPRSCALPPSFFTSLFSSFALQYPTTPSSQSISLFKVLFHLHLDLQGTNLCDISDLIQTSFLFLSSSMRSGKTHSPTCLCVVFLEWVEWFWNTVSAHSSVLHHMAAQAPKFIALYSLVDTCYQHQLLQATRTSLGALREDHAHTLQRLNTLFILFNEHCSLTPDLPPADAPLVASSPAVSLAFTGESKRPKFPQNNPFAARLDVSSFPTLTPPSSVVEPPITLPLTVPAARRNLKPLAYPSTISPAMTDAHTAQFLAMLHADWLAASLGITASKTMGAKDTKTWQEALATFLSSR